MLAFLTAGHAVSMLVLTRALVKVEKSTTCNFGFGNAWVKGLADSLADPLRAVLGWIETVGTLSWLDALTKRMTKHDPAKEEAGPRTLTGGLACFCVAIVLAPCVCFSSWIAAELLVDPTVSFFDATSTAYTHLLGSILSLRLDWSNVLPFFEHLLQHLWEGLSDAFERFWEIVNDLPAALEEVLESLGDVVRFVNFDPAYFLKKGSTLDAVNIVLGTLKLVATYSSKVFAVVDTLLGCSRAHSGTKGAKDAADEVSLQVHEVAAPPELAKVEALRARLGLKADDKERDLSNREFTTDDVWVIAYELSFSKSLTQVLAFSPHFYIPPSSSHSSCVCTDQSCSKQHRRLLPS